MQSNFYLILYQSSNSDTFLIRYFIRAIRLLSCTLIYLSTITVLGMILYAISNGPHA